MRNLDHDIELENYLREFQPVTPRPLSPIRKRAPLVWAVVFASALAVLATFAIRNPWRRQPPKTQALREPQHSVAHMQADALTVGKLSTAARQGDEALESVLARSSRVALPRMDRPNTALNALSGE
jgi:hypothetical protein